MVDGVVEAVIELLRPFAEVLLPLIFVVSFALAGLGILFSDRARVRPAFLAGFLVTLLVFQTVMPIYVTPFINWHKFSSPAPAEMTTHEITIVDASGEEIAWDQKATLAFNGVQSDLATRMAETYDEDTNDEVAAWLLERSCIYREQVERDAPRRGTVPADVRDRPWRLYRYPAHSVSTWSPADVADLDRFEAVRVYEVTTVTSADGGTVLNQSAAHVAEYEPEGVDVC